MILWVFALFDLSIGLMHLFAHFGWLPWRVLMMGSVLLAGKAIIFNDRFLSYIDLLSAFYLFVQIWVDSTFLSYFFFLYFVYKALVSL